VKAIVMRLGGNMVKAKKYKCPHHACKTTATSMPGESQDSFNIRLINEGWIWRFKRIRGKTDWDYMRFCPDCSKNHLI